jgi:hypothetical protein
MQESIRTGQPYQTRLDPSPADARCRHAKLKVGILAFGSLINDPGDELNPKIVVRLKTQTLFPVEYEGTAGREMVPRLWSSSNGRSGRGRNPRSE